MRTGLGVAALVACLTGCQTTPFCPELGKCGGDVMEGASDVWKADGVLDSEWIVSEGNDCVDQVQRVQNPVSLVRQPPRTAGERPIDKATTDWCSGIAVKQDGKLQQFEGWFPTIPIRSGVLLFSEDGTYAAQFTHYAPQHAEFSGTCLRATGVAMTCAEFGRHLKDFVAAQANLYNMRCSEMEGGGCGCDYELSLTGGPNGKWVQKGSTITFFDELAGPPSLVDFCIKGDTLEITGQNGMRVLNQASLRTVTFHRPTCTDRVQSKTLGEKGVDCDGQCGGTCSSCNDGIKNGDEEGIDCGGVCALGGTASLAGQVAHQGEICACSDGIKNAWEEDVDCGGPCADKCTCFNGVKDDDEDDIDCGLDCSVPCTCRNGMQDMNETGVDCGRACKKDCK